MERTKRVIGVWEKGGRKKVKRLSTARKEAKRTPAQSERTQSSPPTLPRGRSSFGTTSLWSISPKSSVMRSFLYTAGYHRFHRRNQNSRIFPPPHFPPLPRTRGCQTVSPWGGCGGFCCELHRDGASPSKARWCSIFMRSSAPIDSTDLVAVPESCAATVGRNSLASDFSRLAAESGPLIVVSMTYDHGNV
jgi:hypothetical protein